MWTAVRRERTTRMVARAGLLTAVVVTVAGLLAMHALSLHGTGTDGEHGRMSLPAAHVAHSHALDHAAHDTTHDTTHDAAHDAADDTGHPGGEGHTAMMLCAAFLIAAGALLLSRLWRRTPAWWFAHSHLRSRAAGSTPFRTHPATGPPPEWAFSVIRC
ncbi:hypothetical protein [Nocardioides sp. NPDC047086]|uniref:hypothetical protein n=1 Tax=Nocardioides sp. NPDC047086 TaxID=3154810 RepID=UPI0033D17FA0